MTFLLYIGKAKKGRPKAPWNMFLVPEEWEGGVPLQSVKIQLDAQSDEASLTAPM